MKDTLANMPLFTRDLGKDIWDYKKTLKYNFWTRSTISYNENNCSVSIDGALSILNDMRDAGS